MATKDFRLRSCRLNLGDRLSDLINFQAKDAGPGQHVTLVMGGNGSGKSWLLAGLIDSMMNRGPTALTRKLSRGPFVCEVVSAEGGSGDGVPSRILALSTLVRDRFPFIRPDKDDGFYKYLGVRQATNLTTTGALDASVGEAVMDLASDPVKVKKLREWLALFFPDAEIGVGFPSADERLLNRYFEASEDDGVRFEKFWQRRVGPGRSLNMLEGDRVALSRRYDAIFTFLRRAPRIEPTEWSRFRFPVLPFDETPWSVEAFADLLASLPAKERGLTHARPTLMIRLQNWISFDQLSSGEQNLLSVGAKLLAYAMPGSFIVIDEPEVSLNTSWQQRYLDLISSSLEHAPGSHVLIATHSPHFVAGLRDGSGTVLLVRRERGEFLFQTRPAAYEAWGAEAVLYEVLDIPSASSFAFNGELMKVLEHIQENGQDPVVIGGFLDKARKLRFDDAEPLGEVVREIEKYADEHSIERPSAE